MRSVIRISIILLLVSACSPLAGQEESIVGPQIEPAAPSAIVTERTAEPTSRATRTPTTAPAHFEEMFENGFSFLRLNYYSKDPNDIDWNLLESQFQPRISKVANQHGFWQVMLDLVREINDPHTLFFPNPILSSGYSRFFQHGQMGVGIQTRPIGADTFLYVWDVCPKSPAALSGIEKGDAIIRVNGNEVYPNPTTIEDYLAFDDAINQLWSPSGTDVEITFLPPASRQSQTVILESTELDGCDGWKTEVLSANPKIGYVRVPQGQALGAQRELEARLEELEAGGQLDGLIYDVRRSSAGITGMFVNGEIGFTESARNGEQVRSLLRSRNADIWKPGTPMVVLIDSGTVSSAEIMALSLQASGRAAVIGTESRGGLGQVCFDALRDGSLIGVRCGIFVLPDGTSMEDKKVHPDIHVEMGPFGSNETPDPQLDAALDYLLNNLEEGVH